MKELLKLRKTGLSSLGFRPSYVLGGKAMEIVYNKKELEEYLQDHVDIAADHPNLS